MTGWDRAKTVLGCAWISAAITLVCKGNQEAQWIAVAIGTVVGTIWVAVQ